MSDSPKQKTHPTTERRQRLLTWMQENLGRWHDDGFYGHMVHLNGRGLCVPVAGYENLSDTTIRRDLNALVAEGKLRRMNFGRRAYWEVMADA